MFQFFKNILGGGSNEQLQEALKNGATLIDVRTPVEFSMGSVRGAKNMPLDRIASQTGKLKKDSTIVVFCKSGARSGRAKSILESKGFNHVINGGTVSAVARAKDNLK